MPTLLVLNVELATMYCCQIIRIIILLSLTLILVVNYCDDLNPLDTLRQKVCSAAVAWHMIFVDILLLTARCGGAV
jgi:hypothetical protein